MTLPTVALYQQLREPITGRYDCTPTVAAFLAAIDSRGAYTPTGREIRLASDEPIPDPKSPGLNLPQVDEALFELSNGRVNLDTRLAYPIAEAQRRIRDGAWAGIQVQRSVLVERLVLRNKFAGGHTEAIGMVDGALKLFDPLEPALITIVWGDIWAAAGALVIGTRALGYGQCYVTFTRDVTADWRVSIHPSGGESRQRFGIYTVAAGKVTGGSFARTGGFSASCTPPRTYRWPGHTSQSLVRLTSGSRKGQYVRSTWAKEVGS